MTSYDASGRHAHEDELRLLERRMCFFMPVSDMPKGSASSLIVALPAPGV
jgi:hypothetical protein